MMQTTVANAAISNIKARHFLHGVRRNAALLVGIACLVPSVWLGTTLVVQAVAQCSSAAGMGLAQAEILQAAR